MVDTLTHEWHLAGCRATITALLLLGAVSGCDRESASVSTNNAVNSTGEGAKTVEWNVSAVTETIAARVDQLKIAGMPASMDSTQAWTGAYLADSPARYLEWVASNGLVATASPESLETNWKYRVAMITGAKLDLSTIEVNRVRADGFTPPTRWESIDSRNVVRSMRTTSQGAKSPKESVTVEVRICGNFPAADGATRFDGQLTIVLQQAGNRWIPVKMELRGWPVGTRVLLPPL